MEKWLEIGIKNGIAVLALIALAVFLYKKVWPIAEKMWLVIEKRLADADIREKDNLQRWEEQGKLFSEALKHEREDNARRFEDQGKLFMQSLRAQNVLADQTHKENMKAQGRIAEKLETLDQRLRNGNGK
jgi:hypothetical protein